MKAPEDGKPVLRRIFLGASEQIFYLLREYQQFTRLLQAILRMPFLLENSEQMRLQRLALPILQHNMQHHSLLPIDLELTLFIKLYQSIHKCLHKRFFPYCYS